MLVRARPGRRHQQPADPLLSASAVQPQAERRRPASLRQSIDPSPDSPDAYFLLGFVLGDLGRHEELAPPPRAVQLNPSLSRAQANLSIDRYNPAKYEEMLPQRQERRSGRMMAVRDDSQLAHLNLGLAFRQKGYLAEALREYRLALDRGEDRVTVLQAMAEVQLLRRDSAAALELYDRLIAERPDVPKLWCERGVALHQSARHDEAAESYHRALELDQSYAIAHNNLGVACYHARDHEAAIAAFRAALAAQPHFLKAWLNLALLLFRGSGSRWASRAPIARRCRWSRASDRLERDRSRARRDVSVRSARNAFGRAIQARPTYAGRTTISATRCRIWATSTARSERRSVPSSSIR
jgi:tetratricopeptide (TPR) repeat protein